MNKRLALTISGIIVLVGAITVALLLLNNITAPGQQGELKSPHFLDSTPAHNDTYAAQPINVTLNFDFDVSEGSQIAVFDSTNTDWGDDDVVIEDNSTALKRNLKQGMPDGNYTVKYKACWPDGSCHDGQFQFSIDSSQLSQYIDLRNQAEVTIDMKDIKFQPEKVIISPNTKVTWKNLDQDTLHFVNTETHPEHTYYPAQNSRSINTDQTYSQTFTTPGQYNYHCSAHAHQMTGSLIVAN